MKVKGALPLKFWYANYDALNSKTVILKVLNGVIFRRNTFRNIT